MREVSTGLASPEQIAAYKEAARIHRDLTVKKFATLVATGKIANFYRGTVPYPVKAQRRRKNKVARASRRINRLRSA